MGLAVLSHAVPPDNSGAEIFGRVFFSFPASWPRAQPIEHTKTRQIHPMNAIVPLSGRLLFSDKPCFWMDPVICSTPCWWVVRRVSIPAGKLVASIPIRRQIHPTMILTNTTRPEIGSEFNPALRVSRMGHSIIFRFGGGASQGI